MASPAISPTFGPDVAQRSSHRKCDDAAGAASSGWSNTKLYNNQRQEGARTTFWAQHRVRQQRASVDHWKREESLDRRAHSRHYCSLGREEQRCELRFLSCLCHRRFVACCYLPDAIAALSRHARLATADRQTGRMIRHTRGPELDLSNFTPLALAADHNLTGPRQLEAS